MNEVMRGRTSLIQGHFNGCYILIGLLYGKGDSITLRAAVKTEEE